jgi:hypothetical protein
LALAPSNPSLQVILHKAGQSLPLGKRLPQIAQELINLSQILHRFVIERVYYQVAIQSIKEFFHERHERIKRSGTNRKRDGKFYRRCGYIKRQKTANTPQHGMPAQVRREMGTEEITAGNL